VLQGFLLLLILFLFYNAELLDLCYNPIARTLVVRFVDNVNILVYSLNTEGNYRQLETIHKKCLD